MEQHRIRIAIVEDLEEIRSGLETLIRESDGFVCVGAYPNGSQALAGIPDAAPDVVLMDIDMPGMDGIECIERLKLRQPELQIMMLTVFSDDEKIFRSLTAGASGYLLKKTPPAELLTAITELYHGGSPMSSAIARKVVTAFRQPSMSTEGSEPLTARETEILMYLAKGFRYKEIGEKLFISTETVRTHLHKIYEKLHVRSRTEAVLKYLHR